MKMTDVAQPRRWRVANPVAGAAEVTIAGWEFNTHEGVSDKVPDDAPHPVALLQHANGLCAATWAPVAWALAEQFHVFAIDARGHGDSSHLTVPDDYHWDYFVSDLVHVAEQVLAETGQHSIALGVGSSFGGIITAGAQASHGGLFERIVMLDPPIHPTADLVDALNLSTAPEPGEQREQLVAQSRRRRPLSARGAGAAIS